MKNIRKIVSRIIMQYGTRSPFQICEKMGINILFVDLPDKVNGFFVNSAENGYRSILISKSIPDFKKEEVCAHELGHALLHSEINSILHENDPSFGLKKFEAEADFFSNLLLPKPNSNSLTQKSKFKCLTKF
ncbi:MAG: hypothetical protein RUMPE_01223 [Eubacteriales bacterium SKADARSKE-1]|nr:hypothetical protein [Eubacteriales bacterium SKADARSKE-1]